MRRAQGQGLTAERREPVGVVVGQADRGLTQRAALSAAVAEQRAIKDSAIAPFYDRDLARRVREVRQEWIDRALEVISDNLDGAQLARIRTATAQFVGQEPTMFASGDLPPNTARGVDPSILQWSAWEMRHSAAYAESRAQVLEIIEASANGLATDPQIAAELSNQRGRDGLSDYLARVNEWAATLPAAEPGLNTTEIGKKVHAAGVGFQRGDIGHSATRLVEAGHFRMEKGARNAKTYHPTENLFDDEGTAK
jgi:hypothetical protein